MLVGIAIEIPFALGEMLLGLEAYYIRDWRTLQVMRQHDVGVRTLVQAVAYLPMLALLGLYFLVPESPRWLAGRGRTEDTIPPWCDPAHPMGAWLNYQNIQVGRDRADSD